MDDRDAFHTVEPVERRVILIYEIAALLMAGNRCRFEWRRLKTLFPAAIHGIIQEQESIPQSNFHQFKDSKTWLLDLFNRHRERLFQTIQLSHRTVEAADDHFRAIYTGIVGYRFDIESKETFLELRNQLNDAYLRLCEPPPVSIHQPETQKGTVSDDEKPKKPKRPKCNDVMKAELAADIDKVKGWTADQWAKETGFAKATVLETPTWKSLNLIRKDLKASKVNDRRKKTTRPKRQ